MSDHAFAAESRDLNQEFCLSLMAARHVGRLILAGEVPYSVPVNYIATGDSILFRTDAGSHAANADHAAVGFEVDAIDEPNRAAWSVLARGIIEDITDQLAVESDLQERLQPWAPGSKDRWMRITIKEISGRWVHGPSEPWAPDERGYL